MMYTLSLHIYPIYLGRHQLHLLYFSITTHPPPPLPLIISKFYIQRQQQRNSIETQKSGKNFSNAIFISYIYIFYFLVFLLRELLH